MFITKKRYNELLEQNLELNDTVESLRDSREVLKQRIILLENDVLKLNEKKKKQQRAIVRLENKISDLENENKELRLGQEALIKNQ